MQERGWSSWLMSPSLERYNRYCAMEPNYSFFFEFQETHSFFFSIFTVLGIYKLFEMIKVGFGGNFARYGTRRTKSL